MEGAPEWVKIMPAGPLPARDGRGWVLKDPAVVAATSLARARGVDLVIDYEHQTDHAAKNGREAPAAGWVKELQGRVDGLWARVEWTGKARRHLEAREYRYLSPTFTHTKDGAVTSVLRAALTNNPALPDLPALATAGEISSPFEHAANSDLTEAEKAICHLFSLSESDFKKARHEVGCTGR